MIAVEWSDFDAPRGPDNKVVPRTGVLLSVQPTTRDAVNIAFVITTSEPWDRDVPYPRGGKIILPIKLTQITVKGVHLPFEPRPVAEK